MWMRPLAAAILAAALIFPAVPGGAAPAGPGVRRFALGQDLVYGGLPVGAPPAGSRQRIGLALSGGGAKAAASIGVLKVLQREGIPVAAIAGTSMGALVGGLAAAGYPPDAIAALFLENDWNDLFTDTPARAFLTQGQKRTAGRHILQFSVAGGRFSPPAGLTAGQKLSNLLASRTLAASFQADLDFDRLPIPFRAIAADLETGAAVALRAGLLHDALRASSAIPVLFPPVVFRGRLLADGGLANNLPVDVVREMGVDIVIAVDASAPLAGKERLASMIEVMSQAVSIPLRRETLLQAARADVVIAPDTGGLSFADFTRMADAIKAGEEAAAAALPAIRSLIRPRSRPADAEERFRITDLMVHGAVTVPEAAVRNAAQGLLAGGGVSAQGITEALLAVDRIGVFRSAVLELRPDAPDRTAILLLQEHPVVRAVRISGTAMIPGEEIMTAIGEPLGAPLNARAIADGVARITEKYREQGFLLVRVEQAGMLPDGETLAISVTEGRLDGIRLEGHRRTRLSLLQREMRTREGAPLNFTTLASDIQRLYALGYFESLNLDVQRSDEGGVIVTIRIKERHRGSVRLGMRYDTEDAFTGLADIVVDNIAGRGIALYLSSRFGAYLDLAAGYRSPVLLQARFVHALEAFHRKRTYYLYDEGDRTGALEVSRTGGDLAFGYEWFRFGDTYLRYRFSYDRSRAVYGADQPENPARTASLAFLSTIDTRDSPVFPHAGALFQGSYEVADSSYGGEVEFRKTELAAQAAVPFGGRHTLLAEASAGFGSGTLSLPELFGLGGADRLLGAPLPGYQRREFIGANLLAGILAWRWKAAEYQLKAVRAVYLSVIGGAGNVWDSRDSISYQGLWTGAGIGIHADTIVGPFRVDLGAGEDRRRVVSFSAGFDF